MGFQIGKKIGKNVGLEPHRITGHIRSFIKMQVQLLIKPVLPLGKRFDGKNEEKGQKKFSHMLIK